jgi:hypothetical protein
MCAAHSDQDIADTLKMADDALARMRAQEL